MGGRGVTANDDRIRAMVPAGERGTIEDVAAAVCYPASNEARYVNGPDLAVDGAGVQSQSAGSAAPSSGVQPVQPQAVPIIGEAGAPLRTPRAAPPGRVPPPMSSITRSWYFTASEGSTPARIWPVIIPGSATMPVAAIALTIGMKPLRSAWRTTGPHRAPERLAEHELGLDRSGLPAHRRRERMETEADPGHRIAEDHAEQRDREVRRGTTDRAGSVPRARRPSPGTPAVIAVSVPRA